MEHGLNGFATQNADFTDFDSFAIKIKTDLYLQIIHSLQNLKLETRNLKLET